MKISLAILSIFLLFNTISQNRETIDSPIAKKELFHYINHGDTVIQNYFWMKTKHSPSVINYLYEENNYADLNMKNSSILQKKIFEEMRSRMKENYSSKPYKKDNYYYYSRSVEGKDYPIFCRKKDSLTNVEEIYFDQNIVAKDLGYFQLQNIELSKDHNLLFFLANFEGGDGGVLKIKDLAKDTLLKEELLDVMGFIFVDKDSNIYYLKKDSISKLPNQLYIHKLGTKQSDDQLIFKVNESRGYLGMNLSLSDRFIFITTELIGQTGNIYYIDLEDNIKFVVKYLNGEKGITNSIGHIKGDHFLLKTNKNAPDFQILKVSIVNPEQSSILFAEEKGAKIGGYLIKNDFIIIKKFKKGLDHLYVINLKTKESNELFGIDSIGVIGISDQLKDDSTSIEYYYSSMKRPNTVLKYNLYDKTSVLKDQDTIPNYNIEDYTTERIWAPSRDGKKIPIDIIFSKKLKKDGSNPLYITGYGSYGINQTPTFSLTSLIYLSRGFVYAIVHPRGESILGESWYEDGKLLKKENTIHDFVDATQYMIDQGYTKPKKIIAQGGSAGGLLMGGVANEKPELYGAIIANVPFVNTLEDMLDTLWPNIKYHFNEIGNPYLKKDYFYIKSYSPLHNIKKQEYPNMLVTNGYNDSRVPFWTAAQYVAKLRTMKTDTNLLLLQTSMNSGHFGSSGRYDGLKESAFEIAFGLKSIGIKEDYIAISGKVVDSKGDPIPFANVYIDGTNDGTVSNFDGDFYLELRQTGIPRIIIQSVGFKKYTYKIEAKTKVKDIVIKLETESKELEEVVIKVKGKDRGYEIIKKAIGRKDYYNSMLDNYSVDVYVKAMDRLDSVPKKLPSFIQIENMPDSNDLGLMFLSESVARYHFKRPENYKEEMLSSRVAGFKNAISNNRVSFVNYNFYENNIQLSSLEKPFISPIANGGIVLYKYNMVSKINEDGNTVYKIKITPRNNSEAIFSGFIYINDKTWSIHSVDLKVSKATGIEFLDSMYIKQIYGFINDSISTPRSTTINMRFKLFGFNGGNVAVGSFYNYQMNQKFDKKYFHKQVFKVNDEASKKDSSYWKENRPIKLTQEEEKFYVKKDTLVEKKYNAAYFDSIHKKQNKFTLGKLMVTGYKYRKNSMVYGISGLLSDPGYNSVEGLRSTVSIDIYKNLTPKVMSFFDQNRRYVSAVARYGFSSQKWYGKIGIGEEKGDEQSGWSLGIEKYIYQYNRKDPIISIVDAGYNLIMRQNFGKYFEKTGIKASYHDMLKNGLYVNVSLEYAQRSALVNHEDWYISDRIKNQLTSNNPLNPLNDSMVFKTNNAFVFKMGGSYTIGERYEMIYNYRRVLSSRYPTLYWEYDQGLKVLGSNVNYARIQIGAGKAFKLGYWGKANFDVIAGAFLSHQNMYFTDYKHFNGNQTIILKNGTDNFGTREQLTQYNAMSYYGLSTNKNYLQIHYQHRFLGLFVTKIPLLNKLHLQEVAGINALYTTGKVNYQEFYVGIENIVKLIRIDFVATYKLNEKIIPLVRIGIKRQI